ncbi:MAG: hypothetical protein Q9O24_01270 [Gammaproteobacteria bacterium]|nr:hypothetical protein [Gammaproteobacteria bacterium]
MPNEGSNLQIKGEQGICTTIAATLQRTFAAYCRLADDSPKKFLFIGTKDQNQQQRN